VVALVEYIRVQLAELNRVVTDALHPAPRTNELRNKGRPDRYVLMSPTARCSLEADTSRVAVAKDAEGV
jgi:hypothetical protein